MINFTLQHVMIMRLIMQYPMKSARSVHTLFYLVVADEANRYDLGFYDFIRLIYGPYSPNLQTILDDLMVNQLLNKKDFELSPKGREIYYQLATALRGFDDFLNKFTQVLNRNSNDIKQINKSVKRNFMLRKTQVGNKIFVLN